MARLDPKQTPPPGSFRVTVMEYERGWGSRVDEVIFFDSASYTEAAEYVRNFNKNNDQSTVPDWYMVACGPELVK